MKLVKGMVALVFLVCLSLGGFLGFMTVTNETPPDMLAIGIENGQEKVMRMDDTFKVTTFNIGYAGLDHDQDFFMDDGKGSRASSEAQTSTNLARMLAFLQEEAADFVLLQEVDIEASRSFHINQYEFFKEDLTDYAATFGKNYDAKWVPVPVLNPMGYVTSGLVTFSTYKIDDATLFQLPGDEPWPKRLFDLDRAIVEHQIPVENGQTLRVVNLHLSAYDRGAEVRKEQLAFLETYMHEYYGNGDYVILGGDWNHLLSEALLQEENIGEWPEWVAELPDDFNTGDFQWAVDGEVMTVRDLSAPYVEGETFETVIDGFLVSPNIEIVRVEGTDLRFEHSDHNPVSVELRLR
ncbi:endonuclease/exonuclease/phosphatase family protein [Bacillus sp. FSL W7-1360]